MDLKKKPLKILIKPIRPFFSRPFFTFFTVLFARVSLFKCSLLAGSDTIPSAAPRNLPCKGRLGLNPSRLQIFR
jgi:hypothetical protein